MRRGSEVSEMHFDYMVAWYSSNVGKLYFKQLPPGLPSLIADLQNCLQSGPPIQEVQPR